jgi:hypothetical protein
MYSKIERGERPVKRKQIPIIAKLLKLNENDLITLWVADQMITVIGTETELAPKAFKVALEKAKKK